MSSTPVTRLIHPTPHVVGVPHVRKLQVTTPERAHKQDELARLFGFVDGMEPLPSIFDLDEKLRSDLALYRLKVSANLAHRNECVPSAELLIAMVEDLNPQLRGCFLGRHRYASQVQK